MDKTLSDYDKNLEELERQREKLEIVMQMMGQEWEESGPGIGWLGQLDLPTTTSEILTLTHEPLFANILSQTGPSPEYLQSLLNVNEALLAQSLANNPNPSTPLLTPVEDQLNDILIETSSSAKLTSPLITPKEDNEVSNDDGILLNNPSYDYMGNMNPESEKIISPLTDTSNKSFQSTKKSSKNTFPF
ncbi:uncharacterized protein BX663DRAFT_435135 [Cokeromyces recurvatus]|uniref:uncharacterized protein n=1 Tax=Cokeromyces recurvatus TaxID=90255 RepID=UPI002220601B|nr:uncharacterized protein BX663DRAFT_435135 [Cokeromyces recurvatus]KAI7902631.1 hypothetical protein BX663DRAFT_435135 [Cokeromyces recurvatus]